jgi:flagellin-specific chaperone FliS
MTADRMTRAIHALHAVLSQRPHSHAVRKNVDAYLQFAASVERAANEVRDAWDGRTQSEADKPDILGIIRTAFDGNDVPYKNRALRKAHDEIQRLRS